MLGMVRAMPPKPPYADPSLEGKASLGHVARTVAHEVAQVGSSIITTINGRKWNPDLHPRDSKGRFIETGGVARLWGGEKAKVIRALGGGKVEVETRDGKRLQVQAATIKMLARPDGSAPIKDDGSDAAIDKVAEEDEKRSAHTGRGDGWDTADENPDLDMDGIPDDIDFDDDNDGVRDDAQKRQEDANKDREHLREELQKVADGTAEKPEDIKGEDTTGENGSQTLARANEAVHALERANGDSREIREAIEQASLADKAERRVGKAEVAKRFSNLSAALKKAQATLPDTRRSAVRDAREALESAQRATLTHAKVRLEAPGPKARKKATAPAARATPSAPGREDLAWHEAMRGMDNDRLARSSGELTATIRALPDGDQGKAPLVRRLAAAKAELRRRGIDLPDDGQDHDVKPNASPAAAAGRDFNAEYRQASLDQLSTTDATERAKHERRAVNIARAARKAGHELDEDGLQESARQEHRDRNNRRAAEKANEGKPDLNDQQRRVLQRVSDDDGKLPPGSEDGALQRAFEKSGVAEADPDRPGHVRLTDRGREQLGRGADTGDDRDREWRERTAHLRPATQYGEHYNRAVADDLATADRMHQHGQRDDEREHWLQQAQRAHDRSQKGRRGDKGDRDQTGTVSEGAEAPGKETISGERGDGDRVRRSGGEVLENVPAEPVREDRGPDRVLSGSEPAGEGADQRRGGRRKAGEGSRGEPDVPGREGGARAGEEVGGGDRAGGPGVPAAGAGDGEPPARRKRAPRVGGRGRGQDQPVARKAKAAPRFKPSGQDDLARRGGASKLNDNLVALRLLRTLEKEDRQATPNEQRDLARWAGWGALPKVFDEDDPQFAKERAELKKLLTPTQYNDARRNVLNAHYTDASIVGEVWKALKDLGLKGDVLEPGSGSGNFIGFAPDDVHMTGVELDPITAAISRHLYPDAEIHNESFGKSPFREGVFDGAVGNVPFGNYPVPDKVHNKDNKLPIHDHFLLKALASTKPGGVTALVTSSFTLDKQSPEARKRMAKYGDLLGAVRLPAKAHSAAAGTDVVTDVLVFRRRKDDDAPADNTWLNASPAVHTDGRPVLGIKEGDKQRRQQTISDYFRDNPEKVLGTIEDGGYNSIAVRGDGDVQTQLREALADITAKANAAGRGYNVDSGPDAPVIAKRSVGADRDGRVSYLGEAGAGKERGHKFHVVEDGVTVELDVPKTQQEELRDLLALRDAADELIEAETEHDDTHPSVGLARKRLNRLYDEYVAKRGPITRYTEKVEAPATEDDEAKVRRTTPPVMRFVMRDEGAASLFGLEHGYDPGTGKAKKADLFSKRQIDRKRQIPTKAATPEDALALAAERGDRADAATIGRLLGIPAEQVGPMLTRQGLAFVDPDGDGSFVPADLYLSGNIRKKLAAARQAADGDPKKWAANVAALEAKMPKDATLDDVPKQLGAPWMGTDVVRAFVKDLVKTDVAVDHSSEEGWKVPTPKGYRNRTVESEWGTPDRSVYQLLESILKQQHKVITITRKDDDGHRWVDTKASELAMAAAANIEAAWEDFLWSNKKVGDRITERYNERFRSIVPRVANERARTYPGMAVGKKLRPHQNGGVNRIVSDEAVLLEHVVGSGKTFTLAAGAMELRRLGLANKIALNVPNPLVAQWASEFKELYPNARILAVDSDALKGPGARKRFAAKVRNNDWDIVLFTGESFESIPVSEAAFRDYMDTEVQALRRRLAKAKAGGRSKQTSVKAIEKQIAALEAKIEADVTARYDEGGTTFEELGIDYVMVDEAHRYKNLPFSTTIQGVTSPEGADRARDMHMKLNLLRKQADARGGPKRVVSFATGTPISNSLAEMYTVERMLRPDLLREAEVEDFDAWAATFAAIEKKVESDNSSTGYTERVRFRGFTDAIGDGLRLWRTFADTVTGDMLEKAGYIKKPKLAGGARKIHVVQRTPQQSRARQSFKDRIEAMKGRGKPKKGDDTHVAVINDGRAMAIDPRLMSERGRKAAGIEIDDEMDAPKLDSAAGEIAAIWRREKDRQFKVNHDDPDGTPLSDKRGALQMVFIDSSAPKKGKYNAYDALKDRLVKQYGMDPKRIRFVQEVAGDQAGKRRMMNEANQGGIDVLIGSTEALGTGTNAQNRLAAMHHIEASWKPSDIEQREGRGLRQGNQYAEVEVHAYITKGTHDEKTWDMNAYKQHGLDALQNGSYDQGAIQFADDVDPLRDFDTLAGESAEDPLAVDMRELQAELKRLNAAKRQYDLQQSRVRSVIEDGSLEQRRYDVGIDRLDRAIAERVDTTGNAFTMTVRGQYGRAGAAFDSRDGAAEALKTRLADLLDGYVPAGDSDRGVVGTLGGFNVRATTINVQGAKPSIKLTLSRASMGDYDTPLPVQAIYVTQEDLGQNMRGVLSRIENRITGMERRRDELDRKRRGLAEEIAAAQEQRGKAFRQADDLVSAERRMRLVSTLLNPNATDDQNEAIGPEAREAMRSEYDRLKEASSGRDSGPRRPAAGQVVEPTAVPDTPPPPAPELERAPEPDERTFESLDEIRATEPLTAGDEPALGEAAPADTAPDEVAPDETPDVVEDTVPDDVPVAEEPAEAADVAAAEDAPVEDAPDEIAPDTAPTVARDEESPPEDAATPAEQGPRVGDESAPDSAPDSAPADDVRAFDSLEEIARTEPEPAPDVAPEPRADETPSYVVDALGTINNNAPNADYRQDTGTDVPEGTQLWRAVLPGSRSPQWLAFTDDGQLLEQGRERRRVLENAERTRGVLADRDTTPAAPEVAAPEAAPEAPEIAPEPGDVNESAAAPEAPGGPEFSDVERAQIANAAADHAGRYKQIGDPGRYVAEGHLKDLVDKYGLGPVWEAVDRVLADDPSIADRPDSERSRLAGERQARAKRVAGDAFERMQAGDYDGALAGLDEAERIDPDYRPGDAPYDRLRNVVRQQRDAAEGADEAAPAPAEAPDTAPSVPERNPDFGQRIGEPTIAQQANGSTIFETVGGRRPGQTIDRPVWHVRKEDGAWGAYRGQAGDQAPPERSFGTQKEAERWAMDRANGVPDPDEVAEPDTSTPDVTPTEGPRAPELLGRTKHVIGDGDAVAVKGTRGYSIYRAIDPDQVTTDERDGTFNPANGNAVYEHDGRLYEDTGDAAATLAEARQNFTNGETEQEKANRLHAENVAADPIGYMTFDQLRNRLGELGEDTSGYTSRGPMVERLRELEGNGPADATPEAPDVPEQVAPDVPEVPEAAAPPAEPVNTSDHDEIVRRMGIGDLVDRPNPDAFTSGQIQQERTHLRTADAMLSRLDGDSDAALTRAAIADRLAELDRSYSALEADDLKGRTRLGDGFTMQYQREGVKKRLNVADALEAETAVISDPDGNEIATLDAVMAGGARRWRPAVAGWPGGDFDSPIRAAEAVRTFLAAQGGREEDRRAGMRRSGWTDPEIDRINRLRRAFGLAQRRGDEDGMRRAREAAAALKREVAARHERNEAAPPPAPETSEQPAEPLTSTPENADAPNIPEAPREPAVPENPDVPVAAESPEMRNVPEADRGDATVDWDMDLAGMGEAELDRRQEALWQRLKDEPNNQDLREFQDEVAAQHGRKVEARRLAEQAASAARDDEDLANRVQEWQAHRDSGVYEPRDEHIEPGDVRPGDVVQSSYGGQPWEVREVQTEDDGALRLVGNSRDGGREVAPKWGPTSNGLRLVERRVGDKPAEAPESPAAPAEPAPEAPAEAPAPEPEIRQGVMGDALNPGEVVRTVSGRVTTPFPKVDLSSTRKTTNTLKRVDDWLMDNAREEARARGLLFPASEKGPYSQSDKDMAEAVLFDPSMLDIEPKRSILKPLVRDEERATEPEAPAAPEVPEAEPEAAPEPEIPDRIDQIVSYQGADARSDRDARWNMMARFVDAGTGQAIEGRIIDSTLLKANGKEAKYGDTPVSTRVKMSVDGPDGKHHYVDVMLRPGDTFQGWAKRDLGTVHWNPGFIERRDVRGLLRDRENLATELRSMEAMGAPQEHIDKHREWIDNIDRELATRPMGDDEDQDETPVPVGAPEETADRDREDEEGYRPARRRNRGGAGNGAPGGGGPGGPGGTGVPDLPEGPAEEPAPVAAAEEAARDAAASADNTPEGPDAAPAGEQAEAVAEFDHAEPTSPDLPDELPRTETEVEPPSAPEALEGEKFPPTPQQQAVIDAVVRDRHDTLVQAKAGAGKTSTLEMIARRLGLSRPDEHVAYIAFNKSVQVEAEGRMPDNVEPRTGHSIAYVWAGRDYTDLKFPDEDSTNPGPQALRPDAIARELGITRALATVDGGDPLTPSEQARFAQLTVDAFANSADDKIGPQHIPDRVRVQLSETGQTNLLASANRLWDNVRDKNGQVKTTLDHVRKMWALSRPDFSKDGTGLRRPAQVLFLDEAQDTPPVLAKVIADQTIQKVIVGDADQAIYGFTGATDYLSTAKGDIELPLTKSWRFGPQVAGVGNRFLTLLGSNTRVEGAGPASEILEPGTMTDPEAILTRSNGGMIGFIVRQQAAGRIVGVPKGTKSDLKSLIASARYLQGVGREPQKMHEDLETFRTWAEVEKEAAKRSDPKVTMIEKMVRENGTDRLREIVDDLMEEGESGLSGIHVNDDGTTMTLSGDTGGLTKRLKKETGKGIGQAGFRYNGDRKVWTVTGPAAKRERALARLRELTADDKQPDVMVSTAHKAKGLEWRRVQIGDDFRGPEIDKTTGEKVMPDPEEQRLAYVAVTRAMESLDPGSLSWVFGETTDADESHVAPADRTPEATPEPAAAPEPTRTFDSLEQIAATEPDAGPVGEPEPVDTGAEFTEAEPGPVDVTQTPEQLAEPAPAAAARPEAAPEPERVADTTPDEPMPAPDDVNGLGAEWVTAGEVLPGDTVRLEGIDGTGAPVTRAGYVMDGPVPVTVTEPARRGVGGGPRRREMLRFTVADNMDGSGESGDVMVAPDSLVARAQNGSAADPEGEGAAESLPDIQVQQGLLPEQMPVDSDGAGIFPRSRVRDRAGREGVVTGVNGWDVEVRWDSGDDGTQRASTLTVVDDGGARPDGWTSDGSHVEEGSVLQVPGRGVGTVEEMDGDTATVAFPTGHEQVPVADTHVVGHVGPEAPAESPQEAADRVLNEAQDAADAAATDHEARERAAEALLPDNTGELDADEATQEAIDAAREEAVERLNAPGAPDLRPGAGNEDTSPEAPEAEAPEAKTPADTEAADRAEEAVQTELDAHLDEVEKVLEDAADQEPDGKQYTDREIEALVAKLGKELRRVNPRVARRIVRRATGGSAPRPGLLAAVVRLLARIGRRLAEGIARAIRAWRNSSLRAVLLRFMRNARDKIRGWSETQQLVRLAHDTRQRGRSVEEAVDAAVLDRAADAARAPGRVA